MPPSGGRVHIGYLPRNRVVGDQFMQKEAGHIAKTRAGFLDRTTLVVLIVSTSLTIELFALLCIRFLRGNPHAVCAFLGVGF
jgi:hypothetical protein